MYVVELSFKKVSYEFSFMSEDAASWFIIGAQSAKKEGLLISGHTVDSSYFCNKFSCDVCNCVNDEDIIYCKHCGHEHPKFQVHDI
jgi:hypothetical protein